MTFRRKHAAARRSLWLAAIPFGLLIALAGLAAPPLAADAAGPALSQCNGGDGGGSVIVCTITVVNTLGAGATGSSENGGGSKLVCSVSIVNTIVAAATPTAVPTSTPTSATVTAPRSTPTVGTSGGTPPVPETGGTQLATIVGAALVVPATTALITAARRRRSA